MEYNETPPFDQEKKFILDSILDEYLSYLLLSADIETEIDEVLCSDRELSLVTCALDVLMHNHDELQDSLEFLRQYWWKL